MWLVLCDTSDVGALWAGLNLRSQCHDVEIVGTEELGSALRYDVRLDEHQRSVEIELADGRKISSSAGRGAETFRGRVRGVLNRLQQIPSAQLGRAAESDRTYARAELEALHVGWLHALDCPVLNRPRPHGLSGAYRSSLEWNLMAARAGLTIEEDFDAKPDNPGYFGAGAGLPMIVVDDTVTGSPVPSSIVEAVLRLRALSDERILGVTVSSAEHGYRFQSATATPDFRFGGSAVIEALARALDMPAVSGVPAGSGLMERV